MVQCPELQRRSHRRAKRVSTFIFWGCVCWIALPGKLSFAQIVVDQESGRLRFRVGEQPIATYVYSDPDVRRPYFENLHTLRGEPVTRHHPPVDGVDATDHSDMHPGVWMAFGDVDGLDFWRNKSTITHDGFEVEPSIEEGRVRFVERKVYHGRQASDGDGAGREDPGDVICRETFHCQIVPVTEGFLIVWDSVFTADRKFEFGDQEEMGLGVRVATPMTEKNGGVLQDAKGRIGAKKIWSHASRWCDYRLDQDGQSRGVTILCHPENFRRSWMHARNYGLLVANPFGREAMKKGERSRVVVQPGESFRLRYGVWVHSGTSATKQGCDSALEEYLKIAGAR